MGRPTGSARTVGPGAGGRRRREAIAAGIRLFWAIREVLPQSMFLSLYILALAALLVHAPAELLDPANRPFFVVIGLIGFWRYSWAIVHFVRAQHYKRVVFPRLRQRADRLGLPSEMSVASLRDDAGAMDHADPPSGDPPLAGAALPDLYILITSFRLRAEITTEVFRAAFAEACRYDGPVTVVAALVEMADQRFIKHLFYQMAPPDRVRLTLVRTRSHGKRHSLAVGLKAMVRSRPAPDALVTLVDGDTILTPGTLQRCVPLFAAAPDVAALTTDEDAVVDGGTWLTQWFQLRFAQRHMLMCSMGLSGRLLTLTGRMSMFRARVAFDPSFIESLHADSIDHWRIGRIPLLTGDDKSTWFWLLRRRQGMLYVPDHKVITLEEPSDRRFLVASTQQMRRWFGNMLRGSGRAIELGPRQVGLFAWWCLIDQRISMWTPLLLPLSAAGLTIVVGPVVLYAYLAWVMSTRLIQSLALLTMRDRIGGLYPLLVLYGQIYGSLVKTWILFHPYRQGWTRQPVILEGINGGVGRWQTAVSHYTYGVAMLTLLTVVAFATGLLTLPSPATVASAFGRLF
jgi:mannuronan synthase